VDLTSILRENILIYAILNDAISNDLEGRIRIANGTERRAASLQQLSFV